MTLLFVYNANSGKGNALLDGIHKVLRPDTYACNLCAITFNLFAEKKSWRHFRNEFPAEMNFLHKDEFLKEYGSKWIPKYNFPVILTENGNEFQVLLTAEEINGLNTPEGLIKLIRQRADRY